MVLTEPFGQQLLVFRSSLQFINGINDPVMCVSQLYGFDYIITDQRGGDNALLQTEDLQNGTVWITQNEVYISPRPNQGPYGNAAFLIEIVGSDPRLYQEVAVDPQTEYTFSFFIKGYEPPLTATMSVWDVDNEEYIIDETTYAAEDQEIWVRAQLTFMTGDTTTRVRLHIIDEDTTPGFILVSAPQLEHGDTASTYSPSITEQTVGHLHDDITTMNALLQVKPWIMIGVRVDMRTYRSIEEVQIDRVSSIYYDYGSSVQFVWFDNADLGGGSTTDPVTRQVQLDAINLARQNNYLVAVSTDNPLDIFETNHIARLNPTGSSLPMFPGDIFIDKWWVYQDQTQPGNPRVFASYTNHISRSVLLTSYATDLNIDLLTILCSDGLTNYLEDFSLTNRKWFQDIANFWGYSGIGYAIDSSYYAAGDPTVNFWDYLTISPSIIPAMLQYFQVTNNSVRRSDPSATTFYTNTGNGNIDPSNGTSGFYPPVGYTHQPGESITDDCETTP